MALELLHPSFFAYEADWLNVADHDRLLHYLQSLPVVPVSERGQRGEFGFSAPVADGTAVIGRLEAAAGWPVWIENRATAGVPMPRALAELARAVSDYVGANDLGAASCGHFTSAYIDHYQSGSTFVAHTDRNCYGALVAGVSIGPGSCRLKFNFSDGNQVCFSIAPRSLYVFAGTLRDPPVTHSIDAVTDERFGLTFRTAAPFHSPDRVP